MESRDLKASELIEKIDKERGFSRPWRKLLADRDPRYMELYHQAFVHVMSEKKALPRKVKEIILICLDAATSYEPGFKIHVRGALEAGATEEEIIEALEVTCLIGIHHLSGYLHLMCEEMNNHERKTKEIKPQ